MQFEFFDAFTAFLIIIFLSAYFICRLFGLLFQPPSDLMHENSNSIWSCDNLQVKMYLNGFSGSVNISSDISMMDLMVATKPITNVFRLWVERVFFFPSVIVTSESK